MEIVLFLQLLCTSEMTSKGKKLNILKFLYNQKQSKTKYEQRHSTASRKQNT